MTEAQTITEMLGDLLAPLEARLKVIDSEIAKREQAIDDLKATRRMLTSVLRAAEGRRNGKPGPKASRSGPGASSTDPYTTPEGIERADALLDWLRENKTPTDDISAPMLLAEYPGNTTKEQNYRTLVTLAARGQLRLDRHDKISGMGKPSKVYRLV